jgi:hypothetical protein
MDLSDTKQKGDGEDLLTDVLHAVYALLDMIMLTETKAKHAACMRTCEKYISLYL